jgi:hypothetical protein
MVHLPRSIRRRTAGRCRLAVLGGVGFFLSGQLALSLLLCYWPALSDPEYGLRLESLRARMAERPARRPVLFLGSSRVACTLRSELLPANHGDGGGPVVFNFGLCRSGPVMELLCLQRLLADGIHPKCIFVEVWPILVMAEASDQMASFQPERLRWSETRLLRRFTWDKRFGSRQWLERRLAPWMTYRTHVVNQWAPSWFLSTKPNHADWEGLDRWGWLAVPNLKKYDDKLSPVFAKAVADDLVPRSQGFVPSAGSLRAYDELFALCRQENIAVGLVVMPECCFHDYPPVGRRRLDSFLCRLSQENNLALIDARGWASADDFYDGVHLTHGGAAAFTERFGQEVLAPFLKGEPLVRRWPPGCVDAPVHSEAVATGSPSSKGQE